MTTPPGEQVGSLDEYADAEHEQALARLLADMDVAAENVDASGSEAAQA